jgi:hypothetical protein
MRHPLKADLGKKMKMILVSVCASVCPNKSRLIIQNRASEVNFHFFHNNFTCRRPISQRLAESSKHADSEAISFFFTFRFLRIHKQLNYFRASVCVCVRVCVVLSRPTESRKKIRPFEIITSKRL